MKFIPIIKCVLESTKKKYVEVSIKKSVLIMFVTTYFQGKKIPSFRNSLIGSKEIFICHTMYSISSPQSYFDMSTLTRRESILWNMNKPSIEFHHEVTSHTSLMSQTKALFCFGFVEIFVFTSFIHLITNSHGKKVCNLHCRIKNYRLIDPLQLWENRRVAFNKPQAYIYVRPYSS